MRKPTTLEKIPAHRDMVHRQAALAWAPPDGFPPPLEPVVPPDAPVTPGVIAAVTCYVLDYGQFPTPAEEGTTLYTIKKQSPTG